MKGFFFFFFFFFFQRRNKTNLKVRNKYFFQSVIISNTSELWNTWVDPAIPIYMQFYMFNLSNPEEVKQGGKPFVVQKGPYTYRQVFPRVLRAALAFFPFVLKAVRTFSQHFFFFETKMTSSALKTRSKYIKGSKERCLLGQITTCEFSG